MPGGVLFRLLSRGVLVTLIRGLQSCALMDLSDEDRENPLFNKIAQALRILWEQICVLPREDAERQRCVMNTISALAKWLHSVPGIEDIMM